MIVPPTSSPRIAWFGPTDGCFDWMVGRLRDAAAGEIVELHSFAELQLQNDWHRIVLACRNRIEYPWRFIQSLQKNSIITPWAMAVDNWWEGARRTGIGASTHLALPWYRWWDGWHPWFFPRVGSDLRRASRLFSPVHSPLDCVLCDFADAASRSPQRLIVVAGSESASLAWISQARLLGITSVSVRPCEVALQLAQLDHPLELGQSETILLDDTCLDTFPVETFAERLGDKVRCCRKLMPDASLIVAASFPRWDDWQYWIGCGASDLFAKPSFGIPLTRFS